MLFCFLCVRVGNEKFEFELHKFLDAFLWCEVLHTCLRCVCYGFGTFNDKESHCSSKMDLWYIDI